VTNITYFMPCMYVNILQVLPLLIIVDDYDDVP